MEGAKPIKTPMHASNPLSKDELDKLVDIMIYKGMIASLMGKDESDKLVDLMIYKGIIGSLLYLTTIRLDIMYNVCMCTRFQSDPRKSHLKYAKRISRYLEGTTNQIFFYKKNQLFMLVGYCDVAQVVDATILDLV